jgi:CMP-N,N'-diacetyllegionaminic acid synthase
MDSTGPITKAKWIAVQQIGSVVAVVPAKLTSARIPQKNLARIENQALFLFSAFAGISALGADNVFVSSESDELLRDAGAAGAEGILRPHSLSLPHVRNLDVLTHALDEITRHRGCRPEMVLLLQPTHPFRNPDDLSRAIALMCQHPDADSMIALKALPSVSGELDGARFVPDGLEHAASAERPIRYVNTGSFYLLRTARTIDRRRLLGDAVLGFELSRPDLEIDIDHPEQLSMARALAEHFRQDLIDYGLIGGRRT